MNERVAALLRAAHEDAELRAALTAATSDEETVRVAAAHGFAVTAADVASMAEDEATDAELEGAAGSVETVERTWCLPCHR